jgi:hypothetical protein
MKPIWDGGWAKPILHLGTLLSGGMEAACYNEFGAKNLPLGIIWGIYTMFY